MKINKKQKNIPEDWEIEKLGNISNIISGGTPSTTESKYWNGNINWITPTEIVKINGKYIFNETLRKISEEGLKNSSANLIPKDSLILCSRATIGECAINIFPITTNQGFKNIIPKKDLSIDFLYYKILLSKNSLIRFSQGSTFLEFSKRDIEKFLIPLPPLPEQNRIVSVLETWDLGIEKLKRKIALKKEIKKGLMQELLTGKKRLPGFSEEWEEKELREVVNFWNGRGHEKNITKNGFIVVNSKFVSSEGRVMKFSDKQFSALEKDDVVMVMSDVPNGKAIAKTFLIDKDNFYTLNQRIGGFRSEKIISYILSKLLNRNRYFLSFDDGAKQTNLRKDDILDFKIKYPKNLEEQKAIADILVATDEELEELLHKQKLLEDQKKYLLNNLISGQIRTQENLSEKVKEYKNETNRKNTKR